MFATNALQLATGALSCDNYGQPSMAIQLMVACIADPAHVCLLPTPPPPFLSAVHSTPPLPNFFCLPGDPGQDPSYLAAQSVDQ